jgi:hypothetical protein
VQARVNLVIDGNREFLGQSSPSYTYITRIDAFGDRCDAAPVRVPIHILTHRADPGITLGICLRTRQ